MKQIHYKLIMTPQHRAQWIMGRKLAFSLVLLWYIPHIGGGIDVSIQWFEVGDFTNIMFYYLWQPIIGSFIMDNALDNPFRSSIN